MRQWFRQCVIVVAVILAIGAGFCIIDRHEVNGGDHAMSPGHCLNLIAVSLGTISLAPLLPIGLATASLTALVSPVLIRLIEPPPKLRCSR